MKVEEPLADAKAPRTARGERTRRAILDAAAAEFGEKGFHEGSISGITRRAGCALGSFYTYFDTKDAVFRALVTDMSAQVRDYVGPRALLQRLAAVRGRLSLCADQAAAAKWWLSMPMASVSAEGPMPKALSTRRTSPLMPGCRHQGRACPLRRARMTSNPLIVA